MKLKYLYARMNEEQRKIYDEMDEKDRSMVEDSLTEKFYDESDGKRLAEDIARMLNSGWGSDEIFFFIHRMSNEHRTLQQLFTGLCVRWFKDLAEKGEQGFFDLRNQASVELAKEILEKCGDRVYLPLI